jgi:hypothetical protein
MKSFSNNKQDTIVQAGNGKILYHFNHIEVSAPVMGNETSRTQWQCEEVIVDSPITKAKIIEAVSKVMPITDGLTKTIETDCAFNDIA